MKADAKPLPVYFISHGGGPWPWLKKEMPFYDLLETSLKEIPRQLESTPKAILMISAHWEDNDFAVMSHRQPPMIYDYGGFPEHTYHVKYSAPGAPEFAAKASALMAKAGLPTHLDPERGFDHGTYAPLVPMYPNADVPVFQVSIRKGYDPETHLALGRALAPLRQEGVLIVGSGLSFHNLRIFGRNETARKGSKEFDRWLHETLITAPESQRTERLKQWAQAPSARIAHPREDHLVPLFVAYGAAEGTKANTVYHEDDFMGAITVSSFRWE